MTKQFNFTLSRWCAMGIILILSLAIALAAAWSLGSAQTALVAMSLQVTALNDRPGPVEVAVRGADADGNTTITSTLTWDGDDNTFSTLETTIPTTTRTLRFTFVNDLYQGPGDPDLDRNALLDYFEVDGVHYEAEDFDRTGGLGTASPGCGTGTAVIGTAGRIVANCGNQGDWVEYDLERVVLLPLVLRNSFDPMDSDGDGLPDWIEDANHNGVVDEGETDPHNPDTDGDGLSDGDE
ncbi:MAG: carbohydrate-binding domain-containing protein, partial [Anaerolineae bacterium]